MIGSSAVKIVKAMRCSVESVNTTGSGENVDWLRMTKKEEEIRYLQRKCRLQGLIGMVEFGGMGFPNLPEDSCLERDVRFAKSDGEIAGIFAWDGR